MSNEFYSAEEAMKKLGKPRSTFFKEVENGLIPFEIEPGRQRGRRYPKEAIDTLAKRQYTKNKRQGPTHLVFSPSNVADTWSEVQIGAHLYGEDDIVPFDTLLEWRDINDEMQMSVKEQGQLIAYSSLMPLDEDIMLALLNDKIRERDIPLEAIRQWTDPSISVYVCSLTVKPTGNAKRDADVGRFIITQTLKWATKQNSQFDIKNWYGIGATAKGQEIFENLGFTEIVNLYGGERKGYLLQNLKTPAKLIKKYLSSIKD
ncbi:hypothetical protein [Ktedonobacter robiniae]|uniref:Helix-turn-helix domain-containing protein n=1 Tax=Ktedonobacter robiniae TaxID=2778365 RepID=A0ABQ3UJJ2_9CHLR|nr:hypothetical protein [Ktedonobacter robiniae]GHO52888.1 hypothetical protein KSB_13630 [Ktedonobacter robiniae]